MTGTNVLLTATIVTILCVGLLIGITWVNDTFGDDHDDLP